MNFRRKRLNITQVLLIDVLCSNESEVSKDLLLGVAYLGSLVELKAIALRDMHKAGLQETSSHNCYELWLETSKKKPITLGKKSSGDVDETTKLEFLKYVDNLAISKMEEYVKETGNTYVINKENLKRYVQVIEKYYSNQISMSR
jgi:hypothetical protein